jgi:hypothetical protein
MVDREFCIDPSSKGIDEGKDGYRVDFLHYLRRERCRRALKEPHHTIIVWTLTSIAS